MSNSNHSSQSRQYASVFELNGVPKFGQALPLALQHVVAMIVGCVTPAIIVSGVAGLNERDQVILVQAALFTSAISTLLQLFPFIRFKNFQLGSALPVIMGISFAYVPSMQAIASNSDVGTILGAQLIGGFVAIIVGLAIQKIRVLFPPIIPEPSYLQSDSPCILPRSTIWQEVLRILITVPGRTGLRPFSLLP